MGLRDRSNKTKGNKNKQRIIIISLRKLLAGVFLLYLGVLIFVTLIRENDHVYGQANFNLLSTIQLMWNSNNPSLLIMNVLGNIVLFMPLGFFLSLLLKRWDGPLKMLMIGVVCSSFIEIIQHTATNRVFDVDDILLNTFGTVMGWVVYRLARLWVRVLRK
ncbi:MAG TPA: VanZ family protein [Chondromyces sp.]|nr:VanZ family protein [Chondromyces sp.]